MVKLTSLISNLKPNEIGDDADDDDDDDDDYTTRENNIHMMATPPFSPFRARVHLELVPILTEDILQNLPDRSCAMPGVGLAEEVGERHIPVAEMFEYENTLLAGLRVAAALHAEANMSPPSLKYKGPVVLAQVRVAIFAGCWSKSVCVYVNT